MRTIKEMHYAFKFRLNKIDSDKYKNILIPEIDVRLNEAYRLFIKMVSHPRFRSHLGFEKSQRNIDDIRQLVIHNQSIEVNDNVLELPDEYWYYLRGRVLMQKGNCVVSDGILNIRQHDDTFEESVFDSSCFEWRTVNGLFYQDNIKLHDDGTFTNQGVILSYMRRPRYIHNAEDFRGGSYIHPNGQQTLTGFQDPLIDAEGVLDEVVDLAVLITKGDINAKNANIVFNKLKFNQLIN